MNKLRLGIVGTGSIANIIARAIPDSENAELAAVSSRRLENAKDFADRYAAGRAFDSAQELFEWDGVDAVYVAVPTFAEEDICVAAAHAGKHLLADKPFADLKSLRRITHACRSNKVAFLDATHFVHHPRTAKIKQLLEERVGDILALRSSFYAHVPNKENIRFDPEKEPTGVLGDLSWYSMRAIVEYLPADIDLVGVRAWAHRDSETGGVSRAAGILEFEGSVMSTFEAGYDVDARVMDLDLMGPKGMISMDDFVLDWQKGIPEGDPDHVVGFTIRAGKVTPKDYEFVSTPCERSAKGLMLDRLAYLATSGTAEEREASIEVSERTQELLDAVWEAVNK
jgi:predicted dehydrogenase